MLKVMSTRILRGLGILLPGFERFLESHYRATRNASQVSPSSSTDSHFCTCNRHAACHHQANPVVGPRHVVLPRRHQRPDHVRRLARAGLTQSSGFREEKGDRLEISLAREGAKWVCGRQPCSVDTAHTAAGYRAARR